MKKKVAHGPATTDREKGLAPDREERKRDGKGGGGTVRGWSQGPFRKKGRGGEEKAAGERGESTESVGGVLNGVSTSISTTFSVPPNSSCRRVKPPPLSLSSFPPDFPLTVRAAASLVEIGADRAVGGRAAHASFFPGGSAGEGKQTPSRDQLLLLQKRCVSALLLVGWQHPRTLSQLFQGENRWG